MAERSFLLLLLFVVGVGLKNALTFRNRNRNVAMYVVGGVVLLRAMIPRDDTKKRGGGGGKRKERESAVFFFASSFASFSVGRRLRMNVAFCVSKKLLERKRDLSVSFSCVSLIWGFAFTEESLREREREPRSIFSQKYLSRISAPVFQKGGP